MKIETGQGVVFLLRNTKGVASYGSATVWKENAHSVSIGDTISPHRTSSGSLPAWIFKSNIVAITSWPGSAYELADALNKLDAEEKDRIVGLKAHFEWKRQHEIHMATGETVDELHTEEKEEAR